MLKRLALALVTVVLSSQALPATNPTISSETALRLCQQLGVNVQNIATEITRPTEEQERLKKCFQVLGTAEQTLTTEAAMMLVLVRRIELRREMGQPVIQFLSQRFPQAISTMKKVTDPKIVSRVKRQYAGAPLGGGEVGEDPGKRLRKMRLGLPLSEVGEDPGKRMRNRGYPPMPQPYYPRPVYPYQMAQPYYWGQPRYPYPYPYHQQPPKKPAVTTPIPCAVGWSSPVAL